MDKIAKFFGYETDQPAYLQAIKHAQQTGTPLDGSHLSLGATVEGIAPHDEAPPPKPREPAFPFLRSRYDKKKKEVVFTFSCHSDDALRNHLGDCLLAFWKPSRIAKHHWTKNGEDWELRIESSTAKTGDWRIEICQHKFNALTNNCEVLGYTGAEFFVAAAEKIRNDEKNILNALCDPNIVFRRDQHGDVVASVADPREAIKPCLEALIRQKEYEAAYALLADRDTVYYANWNGWSDLDAELKDPICSVGKRLPDVGYLIPRPEGLFIFMLSHNAEHRRLATELLLRTLDRRPDALERYVTEEITKIATLDGPSLGDLCRKHQSAAAQSWLRQVYLRSLCLTEDYERAYGLLTGQDGVFQTAADHRALIDTIHSLFPDDSIAIDSQLPEDHFLYALGHLCLTMTVKDDTGLAALTIELMMRSLDRRPVSMHPKVKKSVGWVTETLDRETLHGLCRGHSVVSHMWLRQIRWSRRDSEASREFLDASRDCRHFRRLPGGIGLSRPEHGRSLSADEVEELRKLVLAAVMMDPTSQAFTLASKGLDIICKNGSPEQAYLVFAEAMILLEEKRSELPFDNARKLLKDLEDYELPKHFGLDRSEAEDDSDPIVVSDEESA